MSGYDFLNRYKAYSFYHILKTPSRLSPKVANIDCERMAEHKKKIFYALILKLFLNKKI